LSRGSGAGASNAFTVYQTLQVAVYLSGFISYLSHKHAEAVPPVREAEVVA